MVKRKYELTIGEALQWAEQYPSVRIWLSKIQRKKESAWHLWLYCKLMGTDPTKLLALKDDPKSRDAEYMLDNFVAEEKSGLTGSVKVKVVIAVKSYFKWNYRELARASGQITFVKQKPYRKHSKEELMKIYRATQNPRDRALITFTWSTAIARESLQKIQWLHLEKGWEGQEIPHIGLPDVLLKGHGRGKYKGVEQHTFLTLEAKRDLLDYKDYMERVKGVKITPETNIWLNVCEPFDPLGYSTFSKIAVDLGERSGVPFGWHDARRYVETALEETKINPNWARKIRGRKVKGEEAPYSRPAIVQLRAAFKEAIPLLQFTQPTELMELKKRQEIVEEIQSKILSGESLTDDDRANIKRYSIRLREKARRSSEDCPNGQNCQQFLQISENDLLQHLKDGWTLLHKLTNGDVIVVKQ